MPYMRTVKTTSGATAVQVVWFSRRGSREIGHLGSAHDEAGLGALKAAAQQRIAAWQLELGLALGSPGPSGALPITSSRMSHPARAELAVLAHDARALPLMPNSARSVSAYLFAGLYVRSVAAIVI